MVKSQKQYIFAKLMNSLRLMGGNINH